jgi:hypothetical protein
MTEEEFAELVKKVAPVPEDIPDEVSRAANGIGYALQTYCHLDLHPDAALVAAQTLYVQGLLKISP